MSRFPIQGGGDKLWIYDLGMVSVRDAAIKARTNVLIPYAEGRLIKSVRFVPGGTEFTPTHKMFFVTPNTGVRNEFGGFAFLGQDDANSADTLGLFGQNNATSIGGGQNPSQILDCGPLAAFCDVENFQQLNAWQPITAYWNGAHILDSNDHVQTAVVNGVSGSTEPYFNTDGGSSPADGTIDDGAGAGWQDDGLLQASGQVHVIAEVVEGVSPMPPYPATLEFVVPPVDFVAGETMPDVTVIVKDQNGEPYKFTVITIDLLVYGNGAIAAQNAQTDTTTGIATFSGITNTDPPFIGTHVLIALPSPVLSADPIFSPPFDVT